MPIRKPKPTSPGRRFVSSGLCRDHQVRAREDAHRRAASRHCSLEIHHCGEPHRPARGRRRFLSMNCTRP